MSENIEMIENEIEAATEAEFATDTPTPKETDKKEAPLEIEERAVIFEEALEAILFAAGHPISYATLARVFEMTPAKVRDRVFDYSLKYNDPTIPRGVILLTYGDSCQLCTKKYYLNEIREALGIKRSGTISTSSMEALAIVAYNQPVTRIFVDTLRRADSSYAMNNLLDRGLIESQGRLDAPGRPMLYGTTPDFLRVFGLKDLSELPTTSEEITDMFAKGVNAVETVDGEQEEMNIDEDGSITASEDVTDEKSVSSDSVENTNSGDTDASVADYDEEHSAEDTVDNYDEESAEDTVDNYDEESAEDTVDNYDE